MTGKPLARGNLELEVADFGLIMEAKMDLRPPTVFVGPSNTGKSYLAILMYALHRFFASRLSLRNWRRTLRLGQRTLPDDIIHGVGSWRPFCCISAT
ncbi:hypothetical protein [Candidatus Synechococcus spongiarum]|uniref:AAA domain-containing protein n=1 Tax=Candidatus Synechococcus spongiarum TaxID=431041 RepID=A0A165AF05_9SYNE|nr:hypothetical protein [Candidatus Synechococcus spongiarum]SAY38505.1 hypothetical protein FLM9_389 [Candidatus Synechococcus spongiarum]